MAKMKWQNNVKNPRCVNIYVYTYVYITNVFTTNVEVIEKKTTSKFTGNKDFGFNCTILS